MRVPRTIGTGLLCAAALLGAGGGCLGAPDAPPEGDRTAVTRAPAPMPLPPAYRVLPRRPPALKADLFDDIRQAAPHLHAITVPHDRGAAVRPMVEWEPMHAIVMAMPREHLSLSENAVQTFVQVAMHAVAVGEVWFITDGATADNGLKTRLLNAGMSQATLDAQVRFLRADLDTWWAVDFGPFPIIDTTTETMAFVDLRYYHARAHDDGVTTLLGRRLPELGLPSAVTTYRAPLTTEGGAIQATSDGLCLISSRQVQNLSCFAPGGCDAGIGHLPLAALQTHDLTQQIRSTLSAYLGCRELVVTYSITDDGTGHLDMYLKILDDRRVIVGAYLPPHDNDAQIANAARLDANAELLAGYTLDDGSHLEVLRIVMPGHRGSFLGPIPFTYVNSTFFNGLNLWPVSRFNDWEATRATAAAQWQAALPEMTHIPIDATDLSLSSGAIHCVTRTIPAATAAPWVADGDCVDGTCQADGDGYDGACEISAPQGPDGACVGPRWRCGCNHCEDGCAPPSDPCDGIPYRGCCQAGTLYYCEAAQVYQTPCSQAGGCGWDPDSGWYDCGSQGADPSGDFPRNCSGPCVPTCGDAACGPDGCGGRCGDCGEGVACLAGACRPDCADCTVGERGCDGGLAWFCATRDGTCMRRQTLTDCTLGGGRCEGGQCIAAPSPPDPKDATHSDAATDTAPPTPTADAPPAPSRPSGCGAGGRQRSEAALGWLAAIALAAALTRRRRGAWRELPRMPPKQPA